MCRFQIWLAYLLTYRLDFEDQAHAFRTWCMGHKILEITICKQFKNIGGGELTVFELLAKNRKKCRFDPYWQPLRITRNNFN